MTPNLVRDYKHAMRRVYNVNSHIPEKYNDRFSSLQLELMEHHISTEHYAEVQAVLWKSWVEKMNLTHLPLNLFLSVAAKSRYNKLLSMPSVEPILDRKTELMAFGLMFERSFAIWYLNQLLYQIGVTDESQALDMYLDVYTNENVLYGWLDYCDNYGRESLTRQIISQFCDSWDVKKVCSNYFQLAGRYVDDLVLRERKLRKHLDDMDWRSRDYQHASHALEKLQDELEQLKQGSLL